MNIPQDAGNLDKGKEIKRWKIEGRRTQGFVASIPGDSEDSEEEDEKHRFSGYDVIAIRIAIAIAIAIIMCLLLQPKVQNNIHAETHFGVERFHHIQLSAREPEELSIEFLESPLIRGTHCERKVLIFVNFPVKAAKRQTFFAVAVAIFGISTVSASATETDG
ncbi:uncharacterized protein EAE97_004625 [Botrytis byssoidea]|uniref:Uncharacterized protein n=1 Tax=Botrytis byssoidea TaxID=139641 RepID=A0A9P5IN21_9HELO|nr:uncharacterized protein EAE97_004625 [Botrytis byssoidea]KAF7947376.1 hypothetical protein EAE97_004625 [Botrytis byssoidea]